MDLVDAIQKLTERKDQFQVFRRSQLRLGLTSIADIALLPKETDELRRFREEEYPREMKFLANYPGIPDPVKWVSEEVAEARRKGLVEKAKVDTSSRNYCERKYSEIDFKSPWIKENVDGAIAQMEEYGERFYPVGSNGYTVKRLQDQMLEVLLRPYINGLLHECDRIFQDLSIGNGIKIERNPRLTPSNENRVSQLYRRSWEPSFVFYLIQEGNLEYLKDKAARVFGSDIYAKGENEFRFRDIPEDSEIIHVQHLLAAEKSGAVAVRKFRPFDPTRDVCNLDGLGSDIPPEIVKECLII